ncbi:protein kinase [Teratosphaeria nubilosa]|uniref:non-specific serine/threonine protein kinase n=1 Tax=Teratosphaeria nubilosa TaxID=161662 RepID=A0A6G1LMV8_9PEZI|nr:protein kinase [Teratosphaeria nubilosa]
MALISRVEEETLLNYNHEDFYPVKIGERLDARYQVIGKLGYGASSTVWFCRDLNTTQHVAAKVCTRTPPGGTNREDLLYKRLKDVHTQHQGVASIRPALDHFDLISRSGDAHVCLIHPLLQCTLFEFQRLGRRRPAPLPEGIADGTMKNLLEALDFLHTEVEVIHCDIKLSNLMLQVEDKTTLEEFETAEKESPSAYKIVSEDRIIYTSRPLRKPQAHAYGPPLLCDFGEAQVGITQPWANIQPDVYRSPEVLMQFVRYGCAIDIWNAGCVLWDMLEGDHLFNGHDQDDQHNNRLHMSEIVILLGEPPAGFLRQSPHSWRLFDGSGNWCAQPPIAPSSLADRVKHCPEQSRAQVVDFLSGMLRWLPEKRATARDLLSHSWLQDV